MSILTQLLLLTFTAMTMENIVFSRALGTGKIFTSTKTPFGALIFGAVHTVVITVSCLITSLISPILNKTSVRYFLEPLVYVALLIVFYFISYFFVSPFLKPGTSSVLRTRLWTWICNRGVLYGRTKKENNTLKSS